MGWKKMLAGVAIALLVGESPGAAQNLGLVVRDGTLGDLKNQVVPAGNGADYLIGPELGHQMGGNLFHSFRDFSVGDGEVASFTGPTSVANIISRVTGGNFSQIDGTIRSSIDRAALFLINPAGISFGENAQLDVRGSFHATTADLLRFESGVDFDALGAVPDPPLSFAEPSAFGFTRPDPGRISLNRSRDLGVPAGETLSLVGGFDSRFPGLGGVEINSTAGVGENIRAPDARVQIAAARPGIDIPLDLAALDVDALGPGDLGNVVFQNSARVDVSAPVGSDTAAGSVWIRGEQFVMHASALVLARNESNSEAGGPIDIAVTGDIAIGDRSQITSQSRADAAGGDVSLRADRILINRGSRVNSSATGGGAGGAIGLTANSIELSAGGRVTSEAFSRGQGGAIEVHAELLSISNAANDPIGTFISTNTLSTDRSAGSGGALAVEVGTLELTQGGQLFARTSGAGNAGSQLVVASDRAHFSGVDGDGRPSGVTSRALQTSTGEGGRIAIQTPVLEVEAGAQISSATFGEGPAGGIKILAGERFTLRGGENVASVVSAGSFARAGSPARLGPGGDLQIVAGRVELRDGGQVSASASGTGNAGRIAIDAGYVEISGAADATGFNVSGVFSQSLTRGVPDGGDGGDIAITSASDIDISRGGRISARSDGSGDAGSIIATAAGSLRLASAGQITTEANSASGGNISLEVGTLVDLLDSEITTSVVGSGGEGGDIVIHPSPVVVLNRSNLKANAVDERAGNITIVAALLLQSGDSTISASSGDPSIDGIIDIDAPDSDLIGQLASLPATFIDAKSLLASPCAARTARTGSFVVQRQESFRAPPDSRRALEFFETDGLAPVAAPPPGEGACALEEEVR